MLRRALSISLLSNSTMVLGWCRPRRRRRRLMIRLGNRRRRFCLGPRPVVRWVVMARAFRILKKMIVRMVASGRFVEAYCWSLPLLRPQLFPLC
ncbi:hypothetical protein CDL12_21657 [Handroanthus impetiginosus]|uniref:Uncharacterized protein n=1 Tax=Handroanthus impetiginosus TaxID=429701 RepID=A0A2G9GKL0_9LAMI|nr:hypothetical protein CDL12_21657 [Handroanthus impetiginosus]